MQRAAIKCAVAMHNGVLMQHEIADFMGLREELSFVTKLSRGYDLTMVVDVAVGQELIPISSNVRKGLQIETQTTHIRIVSNNIY